MNRFVKTALAIAVAGSAAHAGTGDNEWAALDSEISGLASSLKPSQDSLGWSVMLRAVFSHSGDDISTGADEPDTSGFNFNDVDAAFWGAQGPYRWRLSADIDDNDAGLAESSSLNIEDAWVSWTCSEYFDATMGQFKPRLSRSNSVDPEKQIMIDRTVIGSSLDFWDDGVGAAGSMDLFNWYVGMMDGQNGHTRHHLYYARGEYHLGSGAGEYEGAMGSSDQMNGTIGITVVHNDASGDADGDGDRDNNTWLADFNGKVSQFGFGVEVAGLDDDTFLATSGDYSNIFDSSDGSGAPLPTPTSALVLAGDSTPWGVTGSYMLNEEWEFAVRYEDLDNGEVAGADGPDNTVISVGANWYRGTAARWQAQFSMIDSDGDFNDGDILEVGYAVGATR
jgi:hypothetical protein